MGHWSRAFLGWMEEEVAPRLAPVSGDIMLDNISELRHVSDLVKKADRDILTKLLPRYKEMDGLIRSIDPGHYRQGQQDAAQPAHRERMAGCRT